MVPATEVDVEEAAPDAGLVVDVDTDAGTEVVTIEVEVDVESGTDVEVGGGWPVSSGSTPPQAASRKARTRAARRMDGQSRPRVGGRASPC